MSRAASNLSGVYMLFDPALFISRSIIYLFPNCSKSSISPFLFFDGLMPDNLGDNQSAEPQRQPFLFGNIFLFLRHIFVRFSWLRGQFVALHSLPATTREHTVIAMISATDEPLHG
jgi:hypothetical protein